jgi:hypothetical protein
MRYKHTLVYVLRGIQPPDKKVVLLSDAEDKTTVAIGKHADFDFSRLDTPLAIGNVFLNATFPGAERNGNSRPVVASKTGCSFERDSRSIRRRTVSRVRILREFGYS